MKSILDKLAVKDDPYAEIYKSIAGWASDDGPSLEKAIREDPTRVMAPLGMDPDPWQREVLASTDTNLMLLCTRQGGKSQVISAMALVEAIKHPHSEILIVSRSLRQSVGAVAWSDRR